MKIINIKNRKILSQKIDNVFDIKDQNGIEEQIDNVDLPSYSQEDFEEKLQDNLDEEPVIENIDLNTENNQQYPSFSNPEQAVIWAKNNNELIRISYTTLKGFGLVRDVEPHAVFTGKTTGRKNIATWDNVVNDIRSYIINNISGYEFLGKKFQPKFNFTNSRRINNKKYIIQ